MDNKINFGFHAELEDIKSAGEKDEKKIHHSGKQPPRPGLAEQVYPVHGTNANQLVCSHLLERQLVARNLQCSSGDGVRKSPNSTYRLNEHPTFECSACSTCFGKAGGPMLPTH